MNMKKILLISITLIILVIGISCASAASVGTGTGSHLKTKDSHTLKITKKSTSKKLAVKKVSKKATKKTAIRKSRKKANKTTSLNSNKKVNKVINGWNPKDHEVSRQSIGNGLIKIKYDDGYYRIVNKAGNIISYGY